MREHSCGSGGSNDNHLRPSAHDRPEVNACGSQAAVRSILVAAGRWDADDLGCGELVLGLRGRMAALPPGALFELVATDAGVPADLPSWCRLTGHELVAADRPVYLIRKRQEH